MLNCAIAPRFCVHAHSTPLPLSPHSHWFVLHLCNYVISRLLCKWNHEVCILLRWTFFTQCTFLKVRPSHCMNIKFIPFSFFFLSTWSFLFFCYSLKSFFNIIKLQLSPFPPITLPCPTSHIHSFLLLTIILSCGCTIVCSTIHPFKDIWIDSYFWILWLKLLGTFMYEFLNENKLSFLWDMCLKVQSWVV